MFEGYSSNFNGDDFEDVLKMAEPDMPGVRDWKDIWISSWCGDGKGR